MSEHTLNLPEGLHRSLVAISKAHGMDPVSWIASQISKQSAVLDTPTELTKTPAIPTASENGVSAISVEAPQRSFYDAIAEVLESVECETVVHEEAKARMAKEAIEKDDSFGEAFEFPEDLIGSIDSSEEPKHSPQRTQFGQILKTKFEKQGLHLP